MTGHNTTGGYYQSYVCRLGTLDTLHKKSCRIGPGLSELPRIGLTRSSVNRALLARWFACKGRPSTYLPLQAGCGENERGR